MDISIQKTVDVGDKQLILFRIQNSSGAYAEILNYGASIVSVVVPDKSGRLRNVVLRYDSPEDYITDQFYLGSTIGRVANRISGARFVLDGRTYLLDKNDGNNSNHGGFAGFNKKVFNHEISDGKLTLYAESPDGEGGFPGNLQVWVAYSFSDDNDLLIEYKAISDKMTPINFTNHAYFNLSGDSRISLHNKLCVRSSEYLESDDNFLPTGKVLPVENTPYDFRSYRNIGEMMLLKGKDILKGYNAYFVKNQLTEHNTPLASLRDSRSGIAVDLYTSMPGVMFYTGDFLSGQFTPFSGLCMEAQYHPDGLNHPHFIQNVLLPGQEKTDHIKYCFSVAASM